MDISVENERRGKMFNDMNNRALKSEANQIPAKRIVKFINPKNIGNNPSRSSGGFLTFTSTRFSKEGRLSSVTGAGSRSADGTIEEEAEERRL